MYNTYFLCSFNTYFELASYSFVGYMYKNTLIVKSCAF